MPSRDEAELKERADRALRSGRPAEAQVLYRSLLQRVSTFEAGLYEGWLEGALSAYQVLGRRREAGAVLLAFARTQELLEELADDFERRGQSQRAFDCYGILLRLGRDTGSFENVAEGYLNAIRILKVDDQKFYVLQYYEDFLGYAVQSREWHAAATLAREAADYCLKTGLAYERHYRQRAANLFAEAARQGLAAGGPPDLAESALAAAIDIAAGMGD